MIWWKDLSKLTYLVVRASKRRGNNVFRIAELVELFVLVDALAPTLRHKVWPVDQEVVCDAFLKVGDVSSFHNVRAGVS